MKQRAPLLAISLALTSAITVHAADLPSLKSAPNTASALPIWAGFYAGINAGGTWSNNNHVNVTGLPGPYYTFIDENCPDPSLCTTTFGDYSTISAVLATGSRVTGNNAGFIGGGQVGYNFQLSGAHFGLNDFVAGLEADFQGINGSNGSIGSSVYTPLNSDGSLIADDTMYSITNVSKRLSYLGTVRGRLGYLLTPQLLIYGTAGLAYGPAQSSVSIFQREYAPVGGQFNNTQGNGSYSNSLAGWTAGGGAEWMFMKNWSAKMEYLYYDLGSISYTVSPMLFTYGYLEASTKWSSVASASTRFNGSIARAGVNYHFNFGSNIEDQASIFPVIKGEPQTANRSSNWTGIYAGLNAGGSFLSNPSINLTSFPGGALPADSTTGNVGFESNSNMSALLTSGTHTTANGAGFLGGGQLGYNWQFSGERFGANDFIAGLETDFQGINGSNGSPASFGVLQNPDSEGDSMFSATNVSKRVSYLGTVRGRLGYLALPELLIYGTAGMAYGPAQSSFSTYQGNHGYWDQLTTGVTGSGSYSSTLVGWTGGGGVEWMFLKNWSAKVEYLYYDLGNVSYSTSPLFTLGDPSGVSLVQQGASPPYWSSSATASTRFNGSIVRAGVNYHFDIGSPAIH
jgi:outer membrane immunogenic protein